uniref:G_PROTEIN_RECEP_F1_2 domain-containing protein n=1 Tax=Rhabditophanes sp. KR3021 TaxID=114890 RepID=A0AC35TMR7_9BILA
MNAIKEVQTSPSTPKLSTLLQPTDLLLENASFNFNNYISDDYYDDDKDHFIMSTPTDPLLNCSHVNDILRLMNYTAARSDFVTLIYIIYFIIFILGLLCNGLLIGTMVIRKRKSVANIFLINLAISDVMLCITAVAITPVVFHRKVWDFGYFTCKTVQVCQSMAVLIISYSLCCIALDRYRSIVTPMKVPWNIFQAQLAMSIIWVGAGAISSPSFFVSDLRRIPYTESVTLCGSFCGEFDWYDGYKVKYGITLLLLQFVIPMSIMAFCYWKILQKVREDWIVNKGSMLTQAQQAQTAVRKRRVMYVLILMVFVFIGSWTPLTIVNLLNDLGLLINDRYLIMILANIIAMFTIIWNPLLYFWLSKRHRRALKDDMFWLTNVRRNQNIGILEQFEPSPSVGLLYNKKNTDPLTLSSYNNNRRGTLADPTCTSREEQLEDVKAACFLLVPLMPLCREKRSLSNSGLRGNNNNGSGPNRTTFGSHLNKYQNKNQFR